MNWQQNRIWHDPRNWDKVMFENVQDIWVNHKLNHKCYGKLRNGTISRRHLSSRLIIGTTICYCNDAITLSTRKYKGGYKFTKLQEKISHLIFMDYIKIFVKNVKEQETLYIKWLSIYLPWSSQKIITNFIP